MAGIKLFESCSSFRNYTPIFLAVMLAGCGNKGNDSADIKDLLPGHKVIISCATDKNKIVITEGAPGNARFSYNAYPLNDFINPSLTLIGDQKSAGSVATSDDAPANKIWLYYFSNNGYTYILKEDLSSNSAQYQLNVFQPAGGLLAGYPKSCVQTSGNSQPANPVPNATPVSTWSDDLIDTRSNANAFSLAGSPSTDICVRGGSAFGNTLTCGFAKAFVLVDTAYSSMQRTLNQLVGAQVYYQVGSLPLSVIGTRRDAPFSEEDRSLIWKAVGRGFTIVHELRSQFLQCAYHPGLVTSGSKSSDKPPYFIPKEKLEAELAKFSDQAPASIVIGGYDVPGTNGSYELGVAYATYQVLDSDKSRLYQLNLNRSAFSAFSTNTWAGTVMHELVHNFRLGDGATYEHGVPASKTQYLMNSITACVVEMADKQFGVGK